MNYYSIEDLIKNDFNWRKVSRKFAKCDELADELLHQFYESYLRLIKEDPMKVIDDGYVYTALKNLFLKHIRDKKKNPVNPNNVTDECNDMFFNDLKNYSKITEYDIEYDLNIQNQIDSLNYEFEQLEWFHRTLFKYVTIDGISMRGLAKRTDIKYNIIQKSITDTKKILLKNANRNI